LVHLFLIGQAKGCEQMKFFVKRSKYTRLFEKAKIIVEDVSEIDALRLALRRQIMSYESKGWDKDPDMIETYQNTVKIWKSLSPEKELSW
jgi:hypothetical protein